MKKYIILLLFALPLSMLGQKCSIIIEPFGLQSIKINVKKGENVINFKAGRIMGGHRFFVNDSTYISIDMVDFFEYQLKANSSFLCKVKKLTQKGYDCFNDEKPLIEIDTNFNIIKQNQGNE